MNGIDLIKENYARAEKEWRSNFRPFFLGVVQSDGFNEVEFIYYAGIGLQEWVNLVKHDRIAQDSWLYAKLFYHLGIMQANPTTLPPRLHVRFGDEVTEMPRAIPQEEYVSWASLQKPPYLSLHKDSAQDPTMMGLAELVVRLIQSERLVRDGFVKTNGDLLSFTVPYLLALSLDGAERERELMRVFKLNEGRFLEMDKRK